MPAAVGSAAAAVLDAVASLAIAMGRWLGSGGWVNKNAVVGVIALAVAIPLYCGH